MDLTPQPAIRESFHSTIPTPSMGLINFQFLKWTWLATALRLPPSVGRETQWLRPIQQSHLPQVLLIILTPIPSLLREAVPQAIQSHFLAAAHRQQVVWRALIHSMQVKALMAPSVSRFLRRTMLTT